MSKITPFLMYSEKAEEAVDFYTSVFKNSKVHSSKEIEGAGYMATIELEGQKLHLFNGGSHFQMTDAFSLFINCDNQEEVDYYWKALTVDGGEEIECGWVKDRFGVRWQVIPEALMTLMNDPDPEKSRRVFDAMLKMKKIIVADIEAAHAGN